MRQPTFLEYNRPSEELQPMEPLDKARLIVQLEELIDSGKLQGEKQQNVQKFLDELKTGQKSVQFTKIYEIAKKLEQPVEVTLDSEVATALKKGRTHELNLNGTAYVEYVPGNRDSLNSLSNAQTKKSEVTAVTAGLNPKEAKLFNMHMQYLTEKERAALDQTELLLEPFRHDLDSTQRLKAIREVRFEPAETDDNIREVRRKFEEITFQTPQPTPHKPTSFHKKSNPFLPTHKVECAVHSPEAQQSHAQVPFVLQVKDRVWHKQSHLHTAKRRPKSATHLGRESLSSEHVPHNVEARMNELWDLKDVNTDFEERLVCSKKDCGPCWGGHLHENCYHQHLPLWKRTDLLAKTSTYVPLSDHEIRLLKEGKILHCHYRHNYEKVNIKNYIHKTLEDLSKEKEKQQQEEAARKQQREEIEQLNAKIKADNMKLKRKKFDLPVNKRFAVGIASPPKQKPKIPPEERIKLRALPKSYLKPKRPVSADNAFKDGENISTYFLRGYIDKLREVKLNQQQKEDLKKREAEERRKKRQELRQTHSIPDAARPKKPVEKFGRSKYREELERAKKRRLEEEKKRKQEVTSVEIKRRIQLSRAKKRPFRGQDGYVFKTDLDADPHHVDNLAADETKARLAAHLQVKVVEQAKEFRQLAEAQEAVATKRVTFVEEVSPLEYPHQRALEVRERVRLLDAERGMLTEMNEAIQRGGVAQARSQSLEQRPYRKTLNDHLTLDIQEAQENEYFGLRPNPNFREPSTQYLDPPPKRAYKATVVTVKKTGKPAEKPPGIPKGTLDSQDFGKMKIDTYTHTGKQLTAGSTALKMKQSTRPPVISKKPPPQKGKRYKTKISIAGQTEERPATSVLLQSATAQGAQQALTFGKPVERYPQLTSGSDHHEIDQYIYKRATPLDDKVERNSNFRPHQQPTLADKVARKIEEEPSDEEMVQFMALDVHTDDADFDAIFNLPADKLMKKQVLMIK